MNAWALLVFLIAFGAPAMAFEQEQSIAVKEMCLRKEGVTAEEVRDRNSNPNPSPNLKCYFNCFLENLNVIKDNKIIPGGFRNIFSTLITETAIERVESKCHSKQMPADLLKDKCDFGFMLSLCYDVLETSDLKKQPNQLIN